MRRFRNYRVKDIEIRFEKLMLFDTFLRIRYGKRTYSLSSCSQKRLNWYAIANKDKKNSDIIGDPGEPK